RNFLQLNPSHVMLRTEALTKISAGGNRKVLVTYPEALFEKVVLSKALTANIISFKKGESIQVDELMSRFVDHGFTRSEFVYEPGQFAMRGGIMVIYSYGNEKPYRIELFGNEIDSIRLFDPETQLSERMLSEVKIIPNVETRLSSGEKVSLLNLLPENTVVWCEDWAYIKEKIDQEWEDVEEAVRYQESGIRYQEGRVAGSEHQAGKTSRQADEDELNEKREVSLKDFINVPLLEARLKELHIIEFGSKAVFSKENKIHFGVEQQPAFNRQFKLLIDNLKKYESKKY